MTQEPYGMLLAIDGYGTAPDTCADRELLIRILRDLPATIGMRALGEPHIESVADPGIAGLSGFTFIMESHIAIHTYTERCFVTADIYSCKPFDTEQVKEYFEFMFEIAELESQTIIRGASFNDPDQPRPHLRP